MTGSYQWTTDIVVSEGNLTVVGQELPFDDAFQIALMVTINL